jgi:hypothetical protein
MRRGGRAWKDDGGCSKDAWGVGGGGSPVSQAAPSRYVHDSRKSKEAKKLKKPTPAALFFFCSTRVAL